MSAVCISHVAPRPADPGGRALRRSAFPPRPAAVRAARAAAGRLRVVAGAARHAPSTTTEEGAVSRVEQFRCRQLPPMGLHGRLLVEEEFATVIQGESRSVGCPDINDVTRE